MEKLFSLQDKPLFLAQHPQPKFTVKVVTFGMPDSEQLFEGITYEFKKMHIEFLGNYVYDTKNKARLQEDINSLVSEINQNKSERWFILGLDFAMFNNQEPSTNFVRPVVLANSDQVMKHCAHLGYQSIFTNRTDHQEDEMSLLDLQKETKFVEPIFRLRKQVFLHPSILKQINYCEEIDKKRIFGLESEQLLKLANYLGFSLSLSMVVWTTRNKLEETELKLLFSHFLWYFCNGLSEYVDEDITNKSMYETYELMNQKHEILLKNKITGRWWKKVKLSEKNFKIEPTYPRDL